MTLTVKLSEIESKIFTDSVNLTRKKISDIIRDSIFEKIENEFDLQSYYEGMQEFKKNPKTKTLKEMMELYG